MRCSGLGHRYGRSLWGLRECTVTVPTGRLVALVGPNGSGKTTLMNMAAGLLPASAGTVEVAGGTPAERLDASDSSPRTRRCGRGFASPTSWR
jgi:ABC-2 type transport system ATP-binding protein